MSSSSTPASSSRPARFTAGLAIIIGTFLVYAPALRAGFVWDDFEYIQDNPLLREPGGLRRFWFEPGATPQYYPLVFTVFWVEQRLWADRPAGFHVVNVAVHAAAAVLLWRLLRRLDVPGAWLAAALFAVHPVGVESVAWVTELKNTLSLALSLCALIAYLRFAAVETDGPRSRAWYVAALVLFVGAMLSKTVACTLPAVILVIVWWKRGRIRPRDVWPLVPFVVLAVPLAAITVHVERGSVGATGTGFELSVVERLLVAGRAVWFYAAKLVWPADLVFIYPRWTVDPRQAWQYAFPLAAAAAIVALWLMRGRLGRGPLAAVLIYVGTLAPALGFFNVWFFAYSFVADHFQYFSMPAALALLAAGLTRATRRLPTTARACLTAALLTALGALTWRQCGIYRDDETLWTAVLERNPASAHARASLGVVRQRQGRLAEAFDLYAVALRSVPLNTAALNNLLQIAGPLGRMEELRQIYLAAVSLDPKDEQVRFQLGALCAAMSQTDEAIEHYAAARRLRPEFVAARNNLATLLLKQGRYGEALPELEAAARARPDLYEVRLQLAMTLSICGRGPDAIEHYAAAARLRPGDATAPLMMADALVRLGRIEEARRTLMETRASAAARRDVAAVSEVDRRLGQLPRTGDREK
jgi:tetratricopeptide (TPR) repeat protein